MKKRTINIIISLSLLIMTFGIIYIIYIDSIKIKYPWYFEKLNIIDNQQYGRKNEVGVAIIDSGFDDSCQKYFNKEIVKYDATGENDTSDMTGHGTQMALLIASNSKKKHSIYGINPNVQLYSIRVSNSYGITTSDYLHNALEYCKTLDLSIVNISLGGTSYDSEIENDIKELKKEDVFVICSAGDKKTDFLYPADYIDSYCVVSQNKDGTISKDSNVSSKNNKIPLVVPGCDIDVLVLGLDDEMYITERTGSSYATAIFSGYLTLYISKNNNEITPWLFDQIIEKNIYVDGFISLL